MIIKHKLASRLDGIINALHMKLHNYEPTCMLVTSVLKNNAWLHSKHFTVSCPNMYQATGKVHGNWGLGMSMWCSYNIMLCTLLAELDKNIMLLTLNVAFGHNIQCWTIVHVMSYRDF